MEMGAILESSSLFFPRTVQRDLYPLTSWESFVKNLGGSVVLRSLRANVVSMNIAMSS